VGQKKCFEYVHDRPDPCPDCCSASIFDGTPAHREWRSSKHNKTFRILCAPLQRDTEERAAKITFFRDVTEEVDAKEELARQQQLLQGIVNNSSAVI